MHFNPSEMENPLMKNPSFLSIVFGLSVFAGLGYAPPAGAANEPPKYVCLADLECNNASNALTQDLPTDGAGTVQAPDLETAKRDCRKAYETAYRTLERTAPEGCAITSNALKTTRIRRPSGR